jgi:hypothetical protein
MSLDVLIVDKSGNPRDWTDIETGCCYYARDKVVCDLGSPIKTYTGGKNGDGDVSVVTVSSIIMVTGPVFGNDFYTRETVYAERDILYARDAHLCAYCGIQFKDHHLTIDHVHPKSRGGRHFWTNTVTACKSCNHGKADRTPEEAGMHLLYVPYAPSLQEKLLLKNRKVLADQMDYLLATIPKNSRVWKNPAYNKH